MTSWTSNKTGWLMALGGAIIGYLAVKTMERRSLHGNPGGLNLDINGHDVYVKVGGQVYVQRPGSSVEDFVGTITYSGKVFRAIPPSSYGRLHVGSVLPGHVTEGGTTKRSLNAAAKYLVDMYFKHYPMSKPGQTAYKRRLGEEFDEAMGF